MKKSYLFVGFGVIILIMFSLFNIFKGGKQEEKIGVSSVKVVLGEEFVLREGDSAKIDNLFINYKNTSFPPESYKGDREEFIYPQIEMSENGDDFHFPMNKKLSSRIFHRYEMILTDMKVIEGQGGERSIKLVINPKVINAKILEEEAVETALKEAEKFETFGEGEALNRTLQYGLWIIEIASKTKYDIYVGVEVDANTGEVKRSYTDSRA